MLELGIVTLLDKPEVLVEGHHQLKRSVPVPLAHGTHLDTFRQDKALAGRPQRHRFSRWT
jgi:hypothetical protein